VLQKKVRHIPFLSRLKIRNQIYLVFCLTIVFPVLVLGLFTMKQTVNILHDRAYQQLESDNTRARSILFDATLNFYNISEDILMDSQLREILQGDYTSEQEVRSACNGYNRLTTTFSNNASISSIRVYSANSQFPTSGYIQSASTEQVKEWFEKVEIPGSVYWESSASDQSGGGDPELTMVRSFPFTDQQEPAILVIRMSNNHVKNRIQNNNLFISVSINQDPIFFCTQRSLQGTQETAPIDYDTKLFQNSGKLEYQGREGYSYISSFTPYKADDFTLYFVSLDFAAPGYISNFLLLSMTVLAISVVVPCMMILVFTKYFTRRVNHLKNAMHDAARGDFNAIEPFKGDDELSVIFVDLQNMIANVKEQQAKIYLSQLKEQELVNRQQKMEFKLLASQINPHFIYNTLETIRMMALCEGSKDVAGATALFGKTMRYVLENTGTSQTTLAKELDYVKNYLAIQKLRFDDKVNYSVEVPDDFQPSQYQILPLLLQPIVENAVSHGIKESPRKGMIRISVEPQEENRRLVIRIEDNGVGITQEEMERLRSHIAGSDGEMVTSNIGLFNIYQRIKLFYGDEFGFSLESREGEGTCATLLLPLLPL
jgi:two-component system sensor histidine kinase YesM